MSAPVINDAEDAILLLDAYERVSAATPRAGALLGLGLAELIGRPWVEITRPSDVSATLRLHTLESGTRRTKLRLITLNTTGETGVHAEWLAPWSDSVELAVLRGPDGRLLAVNSAFARKFGSAADEWTGRDPEELIHADDILGWREAVGRLGQPPYQVAHEHRWMTAQGWRWLSWEEQGVRTASGSIVATRAIGRDVTRRRLAEEHFQKLASIVEQTQLSVVLAMPDGRVEYVNPRFTQVSGFTLEEIFEQGIEVLRTGFTNHEDYGAFLRTVQSGKTWRGEFQSISKRGEARWESAQVSAIHDHRDRVTHLLCLCEDITDRKLLEAQLRQAQKMEILGTLAGGISHDFNNLLAIISGFCEMSQLRVPATDEKLTRYLREIHDATSRASALVRQILSFSRKPEDGVRQVKLNQLVEDILRLLRETFPRDIDFVVETLPSLPMVRADSNQLQQVVMNLCVNARDAMKGGGTLTLRTRLHAGSEITCKGADVHGKYVTIEVADTGCGMSDDVRARIFEPFFTTKDKNQGTGLGLAVVVGIISKHGGLIDVRSAAGKGTTFMIHLPLLEREGETPGVIEANSSALIPRGTETVLVVEDEEGVRNLLCATLESSGYRVFCAEDGGQALDFLMGHKEPVDALVLDLDLPRMSGLQVREYVRRARPSTRIVIASGHVPPELRQDIEQAGDAAIVSKPFSLATLGEALRQVLDKPAVTSR
ncbi:hybrid sensor histidine kinase/response regulator [Rariglobus hedericola]|uniref:histidine kinase n=1 Tax=Rariglobus hedericola TaxID=2597822 RepID=A0A556QPW2_9BACT|nr:PAS domain-containing sensor histidine kinase [Rariglobus hedericola]TSJ78671.1 PAS domain S-box protein [Rariglobus hedericola]